MRYVYEVEMYIANEWVKSIRYYHILKDLNDFDLSDIKDKRRNSQLIRYYYEA